MLPFGPYVLSSPNENQSAGSAKTIILETAVSMPSSFPSQIFRSRRATKLIPVPLSENLLRTYPGYSAHHRNTAQRHQILQCLGKFLLYDPYYPLFLIQQELIGLQVFYLSLTHLKPTWLAADLISPFPLVPTIYLVQY